jgi:hypothetical protein
MLAALSDSSEGESDACAGESGDDSEIGSPGPAAAARPSAAAALAQPVDAAPAPPTPGSGPRRNPGGAAADEGAQGRRGARRGAAAAAGVAGRAGAAAAAAAPYAYLRGAALEVVAARAVLRNSYVLGYFLSWSERRRCGDLGRPYPNPASAARVAGACGAREREGVPAVAASCQGLRAARRQRAQAACTRAPVQLGGPLGLRGSGDARWLCGRCRAGWRWVRIR